jgi:hypothetical protein
MEDTAWCYRCKRSLPLNAFSKDSHRPSGRRNVCRPCHADYNREWAARRAEVRRASQRRRYARERQRLGRNRPSKIATPEQRRAHAAVERAINRGEINRPAACEQCGGTDSPIQGHHTDYSQPLVVEWLCARCHGRLHQAAAAA